MASSPFLRHVLTLVTGTAVAQAVSFLMTMVLARVYSPHDMGMLATYTSVAGIVMAVAALRYDMAVMLPRRDTEALAVARLALWCIVAVSVTATVAAFPLRAVVARHWGQEVATWMPMVGLTTLLMAGIELAKYWFNRHSDYRVIAVNQAEQQIGLTGGQLLLGVAGLGGLPGLVIGHTLGQFYAFCNLGRQAPALRRRLPQDAPSLREVASRYRRMPLLNAPNALVDAIRLSGIQLLIAGYSVADLGQFQLAWRVLDAPLILINGAVSRVFFQKLSVIEPGQMRPAVRGLIKRALVIGVIPFGAIYALAPWIFPFFFGGQWDSAGGFARALTPWLFMLLITSPVSNLFVVTGHQDWMLGFSLVYAAAPLAWLAWSPLDLLPTAYVLGVGMAVLLVGMTLMADYAARRFDADGPRESDGAPPQDETTTTGTTKEQG
ncbi:MAG: lipopolysaccharide biosynthesis protein [Actinomyces urogenitalis]|uniref:lipopolysaccharide biosynthesis protein n=1 Tax=Actinomyces urogenitalis TaxID=103621 RepID=UPI00054E16A6|nr:lipopolysaccharide biosynthesis protein [Actinomyces urogenitalis]MDU5875204.1 lipopolysaccharide biosynthesis protein [Actinomyces urogenitalis]